MSTCTDGKKAEHANSTVEFSRPSRHFPTNTLILLLAPQVGTLASPKRGSEAPPLCWLGYTFASGHPSPCSGKQYLLLSRSFNPPFWLAASETPAAPAGFPSWDPLLEPTSWPQMGCQYFAGNSAGAEPWAKCFVH